MGVARAKGDPDSVADLWLKSAIDPRHRRLPIDPEIDETFAAKVFNNVNLGGN
jgi:hypothetical protein